VPEACFCDHELKARAIDGELRFGDLEGRGAGVEGACLKGLDGPFGIAQ